MIRYFPDTDTLYIELADRPSTSSEENSDGLILDLDDHGQPVAVTIDRLAKVIER